MADISKYVSATEAAEIIGCTRVAVWHMLNRGRLVGEQVGGRWLIKRKEAERARDNPAPLGRPRKKKGASVA